MAEEMGFAAKSALSTNFLYSMRHLKVHVTNIIEIWCPLAPETLAIPFCSR